MEKLSSWASNTAPIIDYKIDMQNISACCFPQQLTHRHLARSYTGAKPIRVGEADLEMFQTIEVSMSKLILRSVQSVPIELLAESTSIMTKPDQAR
jgi:hypothetical protein